MPTQADERDSTPAQPFRPDYEILETLGEGGIATVYKVQTSRDGAVRALKALKATQVRSPLDVERFEDEFRILKRLHHPSLPEVFDYGVTRDGVRYIVMEFVGGEPLDRYVSAHKDELWLLIYELTEALEFIHEHDLLHLDLKPDNMLVKRTRAFGDTEIPLVTLIDFGLSYQRAGGGDVEIVGTPHYMAPEVIRRDEKLTRAVDYYAMGVMLYQLVEGKVPFDGDVHDVLQAHLTKPVSFGQTKVEYAELYPWIEKLLSKEPRVRLEAFHEFRRSLATHQREGIPGLERAYALGYIDSLGMFGKRAVWSDLQGWVGAMIDAVKGRVSGAADTLAESRRPPIDEVSFDDDALPIVGAGADIEDVFRKDLLAQAGTHAEAKPDSAPRERKRYVAISGPPGSGKSYLMEALRAEAQPRGMRFISLSDASQLDELLSSDAPRSQRSGDPGSMAVDRFISGWEHLQAHAEGGVIVSVDGHERLSKEGREFLEYLIKRVELLTSEGTEPGIFFVVADESPSLKKDLSKMLYSEQTIVSVDIPPPGARDVEDVVATFHGHMSGLDQRPLLARYLGGNLETDGTMMMSLREAVADADLTYELGRWHFRSPRGETKRRETASSAYYEKVLPTLSEEAKALVRWLCCHRGRLTRRQLEDVAGLEDGMVTTALESLRPYRVIDVAVEKSHVLLQFVSETVRDAFYKMLAESERKTIHLAFVAYLEGRVDERTRGLESLVFDYERAGMERQALIARIEALTTAKRENDRYGVERLCEDGITYVRELEARDGRSRWHVERFFIKNLIDSAWAVNNYSGLIEHVELHLKRRDLEMPIGFLYKYGYALVGSANLKACEQLITSAGPRLVKGTPSYSYLVLVEACMLREADRNPEALKALSAIQPRHLDRAALARYYLYHMIVSGAQGDFDGRDRFMTLAKGVSSEMGYHEVLLRVDYDIAAFLLNQGKYGEVKRLARQAIRLAARQRLSRSLCTMYFMASTVYHEEENQVQALKYLDKAVRLATDIGMADRATAYLARYSLIYRGLGRYGTAIHYLRLAKDRLEPASRQYLFTSAILLDVHTTINSGLADQHARELEEVCRDRNADQTLALSHKFLGDYSHWKGDYSRALAEYARASEIYGRVKTEDDAVRTRIAMGHTYLARGEIEQTSALIQDVQGTVERLNSSKIGAEYAVLWLALELLLGTTSETFKQAVTLCESQVDRVGEMNNRIAMHALLFHAHTPLTGYSAFRHFHTLYSCVKEVCSNLPGSMVRDYISRPDFVAAVDRYRSLKDEAQASD